MCILKVKKFQECTYMRLSIKQNVKGDANLHNLPWNRVNPLITPYFIAVKILKMLKTSFLSFGITIHNFLEHSVLKID